MWRNGGVWLYVHIMARIGGGVGVGVHDIDERNTEIGRRVMVFTNKYLQHDYCFLHQELQLYPILTWSGVT